MSAKPFHDANNMKTQILEKIKRSKSLVNLKNTRDILLVEQQSRMFDFPPVLQEIMKALKSRIEQAEQLNKRKFSERQILAKIERTKSLENLNKIFNELKTYKLKNESKLKIENALKQRQIVLMNTTNLPLGEMINKYKYHTYSYLMKKIPGKNDIITKIKQTNNTNLLKRLLSNFRKYRNTNIDLPIIKALEERLHVHCERLPNGKTASVAFSQRCCHGIKDEKKRFFCKFGRNFVQASNEDIKKYKNTLQRVEIHPEYPPDVIRYADHYKNKQHVEEAIKSIDDFLSGRIRDREHLLRKTQTSPNYFPGVPRKAWGNTI